VVYYRTRARDIENTLVKWSGLQPCILTRRVLCMEGMDLLQLARRWVNGYPTCTRLSLVELPERADSPASFLRHGSD